MFEYEGASLPTQHPRLWFPRLFSPSDATNTDGSVAMFLVVDLTLIFGETVRSWFRSLARQIPEQTFRSSTELAEHVTGRDGLEF